VVFSPYLSLTKILESDAQLADLGQNAWAALNDVFRTDAPIIYAPHVLALGCLYLASVICSRDITAWLESVDVDTNQVRFRAWCVSSCLVMLVSLACMCCAGLK
jgi:cyclin C